MTADGPRLVDWAVRSARLLPSTLRADHILLTELAPEVADNPQRRRAVNAAAQSEYARLAGMSPAVLTAAMEPYLPIIRLGVLLGGSAPSAQRERPIQRVIAGVPAMSAPCLLLHQKRTLLRSAAMELNGDRISPCAPSSDGTLSQLDEGVIAPAHYRETDIWRRAPAFAAYWSSQTSSIRWLL